MSNLSSISYFLPEFAIIFIALTIIILDLFSLKQWIKYFTITGFVVVGILLYQSSLSDQLLFENMLINDFEWTEEQIIECNNDDIFKPKNIGVHNNDIELMENNATKKTRFFHYCNG